MTSTPGDRNSWKALFSSIAHWLNAVSWVIWKEASQLGKHKQIHGNWFVVVVVVLFGNKGNCYTSAITFTKLHLHNSTLSIHVQTKPLRPLSPGASPPRTLTPVPTKFTIPCSCSFWVRSHSITSRFHTLLQIKSRSFLSDSEILIGRRTRVTPFNVQAFDSHSYVFFHMSSAEYSQIEAWEKPAHFSFTLEWQCHMFCGLWWVWGLPVSE